MVCYKSTRAKQFSTILPAAYTPIYSPLYARFRRTFTRDNILRGVTPRLILISTFEVEICTQVTRNKCLKLCIVAKYIAIIPVNIRTLHCCNFGHVLTPSRRVRNV